MNIWAQTDCGRVRITNQDALVYGRSENNKFAYFAVCDGMGGAKAGNVASMMAARTFEEYVKDRIKPAMSSNYMKGILIEAAELANGEIYDAATRDKNLSGMGTTMVGCILSDECAAIVNVGDSRAYFIDENGISLITRDHSVVAEMVERGEISEAEAVKHPNKNLITRALGAEQKVQADVFDREITSGQYILLCSDGLTNFVDEQEILYEILHGGDTDGCCDRLISLANERGGADNITVLLAEV